MKKQIITWVMALALMASIVASTGTLVLGDLQAQLSQLESDLQNLERTERLWRNAVNSNDVVFLPARMRFLVAVPVFMGKEEFNTMIVIYAASRGLSQEEIESQITEIAEYDTTLRKEIRERYLPLLREQISSARSKKSRIRAEMAGENDLIGSWPGIDGLWRKDDDIEVCFKEESKGYYEKVLFLERFHFKKGELGYMVKRAGPKTYDMEVKLRYTDPQAPFEWRKNYTLTIQDADTMIANSGLKWHRVGQCP